MPSVWDELERSLVEQYDLPHNRVELQGRNLTPQAAAKRKLEELRSGLGTVTRETFLGPKLFLRVVGAANRAYSGEWWFDAVLLDALHTGFARVYLGATDRKRAVRDMLRELLAIPSEWNRIAEVWALELPPGQSITGYSGPGSPQKLFADLPLGAEGNRMLTGRARQIFFVTKNPLWVKRYERLAG